MPIAKLHVNMDRLHNTNKAQFEHAIAKWDTKIAWRRLATCMGLAFIDTLDLDEATARKLKGHGKQKYAEVTPLHVDVDDERQDKLTCEGRLAIQAQQQARRCQQIADRIKRNHGAPTAKDQLLSDVDKTQKRQENDLLNIHTCAKLIANINAGSDHEKCLEDKLHPYMPYDWSTYPTFRWHQQNFEKDVQRYTDGNPSQK